MSLNISYVLLSYINEQSHWLKRCLKPHTIFYDQVTHKPKTDLCVVVYVV